MNDTELLDLLRHLVRHLKASDVLGLNADGSVWVCGGFTPADNYRTTWRKGDRYATADSPLAAAVRSVLEPANG